AGAVAGGVAARGAVDNRAPALSGSATLPLRGAEPGARSWRAALGAGRGEAAPGAGALEAAQVWAAVRATSRAVWSGRPGVEGATRWGRSTAVSTAAACPPQAGRAQASVRDRTTAGPSAVPSGWPTAPAPAGRAGRRSGAVAARR